MIVQLHRLIVNSCHNITPQQATLRRLLDPWPMENMALQSLVCCMYMLSRRERMSVTVGCGGLCLCLVQVDTLIEKNLLFSITISHLMHLLYSSILLIKISAFCSFRVFIVTCVPSYKSLSTIFLYWVVTLQPMQWWLMDARKGCAMYYWCLPALLMWFQKSLVLDTEWKCIAVFL